jgi:hypothetical protein
MPEPKDKEVKDADGFSWVRTRRGWSLKNHDQLCYQDLSWEQVEREYGPMHRLG